MILRTLTNDDLPALHRAFAEAFSDYVVPFQPTLEQLKEMLTRRGWVPEVSVAAFEEERIVAFVANCIGNWPDGTERRVAYNSGTGVVPDARGSGVATKVMEESIAQVRAAGATQYVLEVIDSNERAFRLYSRLGFGVTRSLQCWGGAQIAERLDQTIREIASPDWTQLRRFTDVQPAWQNSFASLARATDVITVLGAFDAEDCIGYAVVFPRTGDLPQLAVHPLHRRRGVGRALIGMAARTVIDGRPLRMINIDASVANVERFLVACGATRSIGQFEMLLAL